MGSKNICRFAWDEYSSSLQIEGQLKKFLGDNLISCYIVEVKIRELFTAEEESVYQDMLRIVIKGSGNTPHVILVHKRTKCKFILGAGNKTGKLTFYRKIPQDPAYWNKVILALPGFVVKDDAYFLDERIKSMREKDYKTINFTGLDFYQAAIKLLESELGFYVYDIRRSDWKSCWFDFSVCCQNRDKRIFVGQAVVIFYKINKDNLEIISVRSDGSTVRSCTAERKRSDTGDAFVAMKNAAMRAYTYSMLAKDPEEYLLCYVKREMERHSIFLPDLISAYVKHFISERGLYSGKIVQKESVDTFSEPENKSKFVRKLLELTNGGYEIANLNGECFDLCAIKIGLSPLGRCITDIRLNKKNKTFYFFLESLKGEIHCYHNTFEGVLAYKRSACGRIMSVVPVENLTGSHTYLEFKILDKGNEYQELTNRMAFLRVSCLNVCLYRYARYLCFNGKEILTRDLVKSLLCIEDNCYPEWFCKTLVEHFIAENA